MFLCVQHDLASTGLDHAFFVVTHAFICITMSIITRIWNDLNTLRKWRSEVSHYSYIWQNIQLVHCTPVAVSSELLYLKHCWHIVCYMQFHIQQGASQMIPYSQIVRYFWIVHFKGNRVPFGTQKIVLSWRVFMLHDRIYVPFLSLSSWRIT